MVRAWAWIDDGGAVQEDEDEDDDEIQTDE